MNYNPKEIEAKWQKYWQDNDIYKVENESEKPKFYALDMFPYPSGKGLHIGHPLGYIASDIMARYKKMKGYNVLHPMGFDSFGLPAEQYAVETGQHPAITTEQNIKTFKEQLGKIGFNYDWSREVQTSSPEFYKWTQWIFMQLFKSWYNNKTDKAEDIETLIQTFEKEGNQNIDASCSEDTPDFSAEKWNSFSEKEQQEILLKYRLTYVAEAVVNWCPALGMVLANDEVKDGLSERGGHPVERKKMRQWMMRLTAYTERLLQGLDKIDWSDALKEMQKNWIGKSFGAEIDFYLNPQPLLQMEKGSNIPPPHLGRGLGGGVFEKTFTTTPEKWKKLKEFARNNRKNPTEAENILWQEVRNKQLGYKFRRQHAIDDFIVDFICLDFNLIVEIDGDYHNESEQQEFDKIRTQILNELGYKVIRFTNKETIENTNEVLKKIKENLNLSKSSPSPQGRGQGGGGKLTVFTTRPDTIFGATFMVIAPEHELIESLTSAEQKQAVEEYVKQAKNRSDLERQSDVKTISGVFTGSYAINPFTEKQIPIWIADYVLAGYGTGAVMAVPEGDERDFRFATHFDLPITPVKTTTKVDDNGKVIEADPSKEGTMLNSGFIDGMNFKDAVQAVIKKAEEMGIGKGKVNYRLRDVPFSRQRYWGEPVPMYFKEGLPYPIPESELPLNLPKITEYKPTEMGEPPLGRAENWKYQDEFNYELTTMPGWAGSSWYFLRYTDAQNKEEFASKKATDYWNQVDLYIGGSEHAVGHLLYSRFWTKFLFDKGLISFDEPFKKLINQGMIQGTSALVYRVASPNPSKGGGNDSPPSGDGGVFVSADLKDQYDTQELHTDISLVENDILDIEKFKNWREEYQNAEFILSADGKFRCGSRTEKMSKRWHNVVNPNEVVANYSADTLRLYEMFLGPLEQSKPWDPKNIDGSFRFLKKLWRLFFNENGEFEVSGDEATKAEQKVIHQTIRKVEEDIERFSFNTPVSEFMKCVNELQKLKCNKQEILEKLLLIIAPYAVHIAEELWAKMGHTSSIHLQEFPKWEEKYLKENDFNYPIMINGKKRAMISFPIDKDKKEIETEVLANETVQKWTEGKTPKKVIVVPKKIVNVVL